MSIISDDQVAQYQRDGFTCVRGLLARDEALAFRETVLAVLNSHKPAGGYSDRLTQLVNCWLIDDRMRAITFHAAVAAAAERLAAVRLRLWHDHILAKPPQNQAATEFHQDKPYWPHQLEPNHQISAWIALGDVPETAGCMSFLPGSYQDRHDLRAQDLTDPDDMLSLHADWRWRERVTVPLQAGDVTFHHGFTAHMARPNCEDTWRVAHVVIFMPVGTRYRPAPHVVTDPLLPETGWGEGDLLEHAHFPEVRAFGQTRGC
jgi:ectoine hydroxylase-related dioxygenase (phytanoyl-CoA dioxygenase family)